MNSLFMLSFMADIQPYQFEPLAGTQVEVYHSDESESEEDEDDDNEDMLRNYDVRTDNLAWCDCNNCLLMSSNTECLCCHEVRPIEEKLEDDDLSCITDHEGFQAVCLNRYVIEVSMYEFVEQDGPRDNDEPINELYRFIAYRQFRMWIWHHLGKRRRQRKVLPSCVVRKIKDAFPPEQNADFKYARP